MLVSVPPEPVASNFTDSRKMGGVNPLWHSQTLHGLVILLKVSLIHPGLSALGSITLFETKREPALDKLWKAKGTLAPLIRSMPDDL